MIEPIGISQEHQQIIRRELAKFVPGRKRLDIFIFGSRCRGDFKKYSDLDLWIEAEPSLSFEELAELHEQFEETELPFTVDVVTSETCLEAYRDAIVTERKLWVSLVEVAEPP